MVDLLWKVYYNDSKKYVVITTKRRFLWIIKKFQKWGFFPGCLPRKQERSFNASMPKKKPIEKGTALCSAGDLVEHAGLLLTGALEIRQNDLWGNQNILSQVEVGELFLEAYACIPKTPSMVGRLGAF